MQKSSRGVHAVDGETDDLALEVVDLVDPRLAQRPHVELALQRLHDRLHVHVERHGRLRKKNVQVVGTEPLSKSTLIIRVLTVNSNSGDKAHLHDTADDVHAVEAESKISDELLCAIVDYRALLDWHRDDA